MIGLVYFVVIVLANTVGAISGMGGGVIIKPVFDTIGAHTLSAISFYSSVAVFTMSIVSTIRQMKNALTIRWLVGLLVSSGALIGGVCGNITFDKLLTLFSNDSVQLVQIVLTIITLLFALIYSRLDNKSIALKGNYWYIIVGIILGFLASLLGIGGGPINVALLMLCFGIPIKEATVYSIITIFFSQLAKLATIAVTSGFAQYDLSLLIYVISAAIIGGFIGASVSGISAEKWVKMVYQSVIVLVLLINMFNGFSILF